MQWAQQNITFVPESHAMVPYCAKVTLYYIDSGWLGDQYCLLSAEAVILVEAVGREQY